MEQKTHDKGLEIRKAVLGEAITLGDVLLISLRNENNRAAFDALVLGVNREAGSNNSDALAASARNFSSHPPPGAGACARTTGAEGRASTNRSAHARARSIRIIDILDGN